MCEPISVRVKPALICFEILMRFLFIVYFAFSGRRKVGIRSSPVRMVPWKRILPFISRVKFWPVLLW